MKSIRTLALLACGLVLAPAAAAAAQQDTTHRMPGMKMPAAPAKPAVTKKAATKKAAPAAKASAKAKSTKRAAPSKAAPAAAKAASVSPADTAKAKPHAGHVPADTAMRDMPGMPGMPMPARADTGAKREKAMTHDTTAHRPAAAGDTSMKSMKDMKDMKDMPPSATTRAGAGSMGGMAMMTPDPLGVTMDRMGSGTTWIPDAAPIPSMYFAAPGHWDITGHGFAFLQYDKQGGPRGGQQFGSLNWLMLMASHTLAGGRFQARTMLSLDALTVTDKGYPLLLQSGEAYDGVPLHDRQHPHDFWMELSALYERPITKTTGIMLYAAPSGEPALGPVAFMHRPSAMDIPTAPISHHWQDATHITYGVLSAGVFTHSFKLEGSVFNGREPDQHRFDFEPITLDSYSGRATLNPGRHWSFTAGYGYLKSPERLNPGESLHRATASALYGRSLGDDGQWAATAVWGMNAHDGERSHAVLLESEAVLDAKHTVFGRAEFAQKSEEDLVILSPSSIPAPARQFDVAALSAGYVRELARFGGGTLGLGVMGTLNVVPTALRTEYGSRTPLGGMIFLRVRPFKSAMSMSGMDMSGGAHH